MCDIQSYHTFLFVGKTIVKSAISMVLYPSHWPE